MENMKLSSPWMTFYHEMVALFERDPEIKISYDEEANNLKLYVDNPRKADALSQLLPSKKEFGNVVMTIDVVPSDRELTTADLYEIAFDGNDAVSYMSNIQTVFGNLEYIVFQNKVVQFYNDQMDDINGNKSTLYQDIARNIFNPETGVFFCTEAIKPELKKPLGEWP